MLRANLFHSQEAALSALDTIKAADIKLVQSFKSPPATVKLVCCVLCCLPCAFFLVLMCPVMSGLCVLLLVVCQGPC